MIGGLGGNECRDGGISRGCCTRRDRLISNILPGDQIFVSLRLYSSICLLVWRTSWYVYRLVLQIGHHSWDWQVFRSRNLNVGSVLTGSALQGYRSTAPLFQRENPVPPLSSWSGSLVEPTSAALSTSGSMSMTPASRSLGLQFSLSAKKRCRRLLGR